MLYNNLSGYFREKYGKRLGKICIDGGFSCPNRDGKVGTGGCIFCSERGSGEHIDPTLSIKEQTEAALSRARAGEEFVLYFQNFTNTYAPVDVLRKRYDAALGDERIRVLAIGTRPDCITEDIAALIADYKKRLDVWVELGLQTASDETATVINRGYKRECFERALEILSRHAIPTVVHLIVGLPGEGGEDVERTAEYISRLPIWGVKIHSIYVARGTSLADMYLRGEYEPPTLEEFVRSAAYILTHIPSSAVVHRLTGDAPAGMLLSPKWGQNKHAVIKKINEYMEANGLTQGCFYKEM